MWPAENIMQSMWPTVLYRFPSPVIDSDHVPTRVSKFDHMQRHGISISLPEVGTVLF